MSGPRENRYDDKEVDQKRENLDDAAKDGDWKRFRDELGDDDGDD